MFRSQYAAIMSGLLVLGACAIGLAGSSEPGETAGRSGNQSKANQIVGKTTTIRDVQYGISGGVPLLMNIELPNSANGEPVPAIVFFHGGGWSGGTREDMMSRCDLVAQQGYVGATVEYRLSGVAPWPAQIQDCKCAVRYLRANSSKYGIDPNRIAVWGCSAGGHLAAMMGLTEGISEFEGDGGNPTTSSAVQLVVDCFGPVDFVLWQDEVNKFANDEEARRLFAPPADAMMMQWWKNFTLEADGGIIALFQGKAREVSKYASPMYYADQKPVIKAISEAEGWQDQDAYRKQIAKPGSRWSLLDISNIDSWERAEQLASGLRLTAEDGGITGRCLAYQVDGLDGWGMFIKKIPEGSFRPDHNALALWARGDANTSQMLLELDERDGSRWVYVLNITPEWTYYEIPFRAFSWLAGPAERRVLLYDKFDAKSADRICFGLSTGNMTLSKGPHHMWIDGLGSTRSSIPALPEFLIVHGTLDTWVPIQQGMMLANALDAAGNDVTMIVKPNMGHDETKAWPDIMDYVRKAFPLSAKKNR